MAARATPTMTSSQAGSPVDMRATRTGRGSRHGRSLPRRSPRPPRATPAAGRAPRGAPARGPASDPCAAGPGAAGARAPRSRAAARTRRSGLRRRGTRLMRRSRRCRGGPGRRLAAFGRPCAAFGGRRDPRRLAGDPGEELLPGPRVRHDRRLHPGPPRLRDPPADPGQLLGPVRVRVDREQAAGGDRQSRALRRQVEPMVRPVDLQERPGRRGGGEDLVPGEVEVVARPLARASGPPGAR